MFCKDASGMATHLTYREQGTGLSYSLKPVVGPSVYPFVRPFVHPPESLLGPKDPSPPQELERSPCRSELSSIGIIYLAWYKVDKT